MKIGFRQDNRIRDGRQDYHLCIHVKPIAAEAEADEPLKLCLRCHLYHHIGGYSNVQAVITRQFVDCAGGDIVKCVSSQMTENRTVDNIAYQMSNIKCILRCNKQFLSIVTQTGRTIHITRKTAIKRYSRLCRAIEDRIKILSEINPTPVDGESNTFQIHFPWIGITFVDTQANLDYLIESEVGRCNQWRNECNKIINMCKQFDSYPAHTRVRA